MTLLYANSGVQTREESITGLPLIVVPGNYEANRGRWVTVVRC
jgi:hypothetical protein